MTVKTAVSFTDRHHDYAKKMVDEGVYASVSSVVATGIEQVMRDEAEREAALEAMKETISQRMKTDRSEWIEVNESDQAFANARARLLAKQK